MTLFRCRARHSKDGPLLDRANATCEGKRADADCNEVQEVSFQLSRTEKTCPISSVAFSRSYKYLNLLEDR